MCITRIDDVPNIYEQKINMRWKMKMSFSLWFIICDANYNSYSIDMTKEDDILWQNVVLSLIFLSARSRLYDTKIFSNFFSAL